MPFILNKDKIIKEFKDHTIRDVVALFMLLGLIFVPIYKFNFYYKDIDGVGRNVFSGNTFFLGEREISLFEINVKKGLCNNRDCMDLAQETLHSLVNDRFINCKWSDRDRDNRFKSKCYVDGLSIAEQLVNFGVAQYK